MMTNSQLLARQRLAREVGYSFVGLRSSVCSAGQAAGRQSVSDAARASCQTPGRPGGSTYIPCVPSGPFFSLPPQLPSHVLGSVFPSARQRYSMIDHLARARACCPPGGRAGFCVSKLRRAALLRGMRDESRMGGRVAHGFAHDSHGEPAWCSGRIRARSGCRWSCRVEAVGMEVSLMPQGRRG